MGSLLDTAPVGSPLALTVVDPSGHRTRLEIHPIPFCIGRQADNHLILRDSRASRHHAQIVCEDGELWIEDLQSRHGTIVNGFRIRRHKLAEGDHVDFGFADSYRLIVSPFMPEQHPRNLAAALPAVGRPAAAPGGENLAKLRAVVEIARALENSLSLDEVLAAVIDAALAVTGAERGFLLLRSEEEGLEVRVARDHRGVPLPESDLRVPTRVIQRALANRRDLLSMNFDPAGEGGIQPSHTVAALDLRSVVCVPLVRIRAGSVQETRVSSTLQDTVGLLYLDSRAGRADLAAGNRELLTTFAIEASTVLENARLLEEERARQRLDEELKIARHIQENLLPRHLPQQGWFRVAGRSIPSQQVGGDYFDIQQLAGDRWAAIIVDVSGKGVSSALLASLLQGVFLGAIGTPQETEATFHRVNQFLLERTPGAKYATICLCIVERRGILRYVNAGHCVPLIVEPDGAIEKLAANAFPVGLLEEATFPVEERKLQPGSKIVLYSDGLTEARGAHGEFFGEKRLRELLSAHKDAGAAELQSVIELALHAYTGGTVQRDDMTLLILEFSP
jgi:phosphoserine phosphatase RsbU/P